MPRFPFLSFGSGTKKNKSIRSTASTPNLTQGGDVEPFVVVEEAEAPPVIEASTSQSEPSRLSTSANRHRSHLARESAPVRNANLANVQVGDRGANTGRTSVIDIPKLPPGSPATFRYNFDYITKGASAVDGNYRSGGGRERGRPSSSSGTGTSMSTSRGTNSFGSGITSASHPLLHPKRRPSSVCESGSNSRRHSLAAPPPAALRSNVGHNNHSHHVGDGVKRDNGWHDRNIFGSQYGMVLPGHGSKKSMVATKAVTSAEPPTRAFDQQLRRRSQPLTFHQCYSSPSLALFPTSQSDADADAERCSLSSLSSTSSSSSFGSNSDSDSPPTSGSPSPASSPPEKPNPLDEIESSQLFQAFSSPARRAALEREFEEERRRREAEYTRQLRWRYVAGILLSRSSGKPMSASSRAFPNVPPGLGLELGAEDEAHAVRVRKAYVKSSLSSVIVLEVQ